MTGDSQRDGSQSLQENLDQKGQVSLQQQCESPGGHICRRGIRKQRHKEETFGRLLLEEAVTPSDLDTEKDSSIRLWRSVCPFSLMLNCACE